MDFFVRLIFYSIIVFSFSDPLPLNALTIFNGTTESQIYEKAQVSENNFRNG